MKTLKLALIALGLTAIIGHVKADEPKKRTFLTVKYTISSFIEADARGNCDGLSDIISENAKFNMMRGNQLISFDKKQLIKHMETLHGVVQNCTTNYKVVEAYGNYSLIKVEMKYPAFTRTNYVTMNECSDGWKITNVNSIFTK